MDYEISDSEVKKEQITSETLSKLRDLGYDLRIIVMTHMKSDGKQTNRKKAHLRKEKKIRHDALDTDLFALRQHVPEVITSEEVARILQHKRRPGGVANGNESHAMFTLRLNVELDPNQNELRIDKSRLTSVHLLLLFANSVLLARSLAVVPIYALY